MNQKPCPRCGYADGIDPDDCLLCMGSMRVPDEPDDCAYDDDDSGYDHVEALEELEEANDDR